MGLLAAELAWELLGLLGAAAGAWALLGLAAAAGAGALLGLLAAAAAAAGAGTLLGGDSPFGEPFGERTIGSSAGSAWWKGDAHQASLLGPFMGDCASRVRPEMKDRAAHPR